TLVSVAFSRAILTASESGDARFACDTRYAGTTVSSKIPSPSTWRVSGDTASRCVKPRIVVASIRYKKPSGGGLCQRGFRGGVGGDSPARCVKPRIVVASIRYKKSSGGGLWPTVFRVCV